MYILLVEDDVDLGNLLTRFLEMNHLPTFYANCGNRALELIDQYEFQLAIIDVMLPDINGFELVKVLTSRKEDLQFLFLTAKNNKEDIITGLNLGAIDYITKPFEPEELILRLKVALLRNSDGTHTDLVLGESFLNFGELKLKTPKNEYKLTRREAELLRFIISNKNRLLKREILLKTIWGANDFFLGRSMDVFISRLRKYFNDDPRVLIETFRRTGYIFRDQHSQ